METLLGPLHPHIVHTPIVFFVFSLLFDVVGVALDAPWWRKAATAMLVIGILGAGLAVLSGESASSLAEHNQGVPARLIANHSQIAKTALWFAIGALLARTLATFGWLGGSRQVVTALAFLLHFCAVGTIVVGAHRGGLLVYRHGAGVSVGGKLLKHPAAAGSEAAPSASRPPSH